VFKSLRKVDLNKSKLNFHKLSIIPTTVQCTTGIRNQIGSREYKEMNFLNKKM